MIKYECSVIPLRAKTLVHYMHMHSVIEYTALFFSCVARIDQWSLHAFAIPNVNWQDKRSPLQKKQKLQVR